MTLLTPWRPPAPLCIAIRLSVVQFIYIILLYTATLALVASQSLICWGRFMCKRLTK